MGSNWDFISWGWDRRAGKGIVSPLNCHPRAQVGVRFGEFDGESGDTGLKEILWLKELFWELNNLLWGLKDLLRGQRSIFLLNELFWVKGASLGVKGAFFG